MEFHHYDKSIVDTLIPVNIHSFYFLFIKTLQGVKNMSIFSKAFRKDDKNSAVRNFMDGVSYEINPLDTLKMITASSVFGEPQYYRDGTFAEKTIHKDGIFEIDKAFVDYSIEAMDKFKGMTTSDIMEKAIDDALKYDFKAVLEYAVELRTKFLMRLNPQIIMVRASIMTEERKAFTKQYPELFSQLNMKVMQRADDVISQFTYYLYMNDRKKNNLPNILKRSWKKRIEKMSRYEIYKYRNHGLGLIDVIRVCHANNKDIDELMKTGTIEMPDEEKTWETMRTAGSSWTEIFDTIKIGHMALLRNLRGIFKENDDVEFSDDVLNKLIKGVPNGKQFPFRYMSARDAVMKESEISDAQKTAVSDALEECMDISVENLPKLKGNNAFLSDNSGSAWGVFTSEFGTVRIAEIDNLSAVIGAVNSDRGTVFKFGDLLLPFPISKKTGILKQAKQISSLRNADVGGSTENGIWLFFDEAIKKKKHYDNIFIYSDMQAGHGGLYGTSEDREKYSAKGYAYKVMYIDVAKLIDTYRREVNPKVNVFCIQTAGYNNTLVPEYGYRTNILYGWTGKEILFADTINKFWDELDERNSSAGEQN